MTNFQLLLIITPVASVVLWGFIDAKNRMIRLLEERNQQLFQLNLDLVRKQSSGTASTIESESDARD